jgi:hypothetical protein
MSDRPKLHIIHIVRQDPVEWLKSKYLADTSRAYAGKAYPEQMKLEIPVFRALRRLQTKQWIDSQLEALGRSNPYLRVDYEEFLESNRAVVESLMGFLNCDPGRLGEFDYRKQQKQSRRAAREYITNYDQLVAALKSDDARDA